MIKCKECGGDVSSKAETCPHCGARVKPKSMGCGALIGVILLGAFVVTLIGGLLSSNSSDSSRASTSASSEEQPLKTDPLPPGSQWIYYNESDDMSKGNYYVAYVYSTNTINFDFPYSGSQHAKLTLRTHPRHGKDVIFQIEKGQLLCSSYDGCNVLVRFDDGSPTHFSAMPPSDNSSETLFIQNYSRFVGNMLKAKKVRISSEVYQEGSPVFEFDVSNFDQTKYKPKQ